MYNIMPRKPDRCLAKLDYGQSLKRDEGECFDIGKTPKVLVVVSKTCIQGIGTLLYPVSAVARDFVAPLEIFPSRPLHQSHSSSSKLPTLKYFRYVVIGLRIAETAATITLLCDLYNKQSVTGDYVSCKI